MESGNENPGTLAGAHRADITMLAGKSDVLIGTETALDLQVRRLLERYAVSHPVAILIAELAFASGRRA
jgi:hypothetical protein